MSHFIDIKEAAKYTGKSISTIKRLINEIREDKGLYAKVIQEEQTNRGFKYTISKDHLQKHFKIKVGQTRSKKRSNELGQDVGHELVQNKENELLKKDIEHLTERIKDKDKQIDHLQKTNEQLVQEITNHTQQLRELNFIIATQQQQQLEGGKSQEPQPQNEEQPPTKPIEPSKQGGIIFVLSILLILLLVAFLVSSLD